MLDLDEIEARALHVGEHGFYPNSHLSAGKVLCDVTALIAELRKLREENARLKASNENLCNLIRPLPKPPEVVEDEETDEDRERDLMPGGFP